MIFSLIIYFLFAVLLFVVAILDWNTLRISNVAIVGFIVLWAVWRIGLGIGNVIVGADFLTGFLASSPLWSVSFADSIISAVLIGGILLVVSAIYEAVTKRRAMGGGDIKLLAVVALFLGIERGILCLLIACVAGIIISLFVPRARWGNESMTVEEGRQRVFHAVPFGPAIAIGTLFALIIPVMPF